MWLIYTISVSSGGEENATTELQRDADIVRADAALAD